MKRLNLAGTEFGRLTVVETDGSYKWKCSCVCGAVVSVLTASLRSGNTKSCGCLRNEGPAVKHGKSNTSIYRIWVGILKRCLNKDDKACSFYGARGITVCERWLMFENFLEDMGDKPVGKSLERVDNDGSYSKDNCRWATPKERANNTRRNRRITAFGRTLTMAQWAEETGIHYRCLYKRIRLGWESEKALTKVQV